MSDKRFTILSIEDNEPDFYLLKRALEKIPNLRLEIININNGKGALDFIYKKNEHQSAPTPDIIILDINLPYINGKEILKTIKNDEKYKMIPVIIFSTSDCSIDIENLYKSYANSYLTKTSDVDELFKKIAVMGEYWLKISEIPGTNNFCFVQNDKKEIEK